MRTDVTPTRDALLACVAPQTMRPFSNGSEYADWSERNCFRCAKAVDMSPDEERGCDMEVELALGYFGHGQIPVAIAHRLGCYDDELKYPARRCPEFVARDGGAA